MLIKYCGCGELISATVKRCDKCQDKLNEKKKQYNKTYDMYSRSKDSARFYNSPAWKAKRKQMIHRYDYIDIYEWYMNGEIVSGDVVHHIVPLKEDRLLSLNSSNLICISDKTHSFIHACYDMSDKKKKEMQMLLTGLVENWNRERGYTP